MEDTRVQPDPPPVTDRATVAGKYLAKYDGLSAKQWRFISDVLKGKPLLRAARGCLKRYTQRRLLWILGKRLQNRRVRRTLLLALRLDGNSKVFDQVLELLADQTISDAVANDADFAAKVQKGLRQNGPAQNATGDSDADADRGLGSGSAGALQPSAAPAKRPPRLRESAFSQPHPRRSVVVSKPSSPPPPPPGMGEDDPPKSES
jgi:hypothetical protein